MANEVAERIQKSEGISREIAQVLVSRFICREYNSKEIARPHEYPLICREDVSKEIAQHLDYRLIPRPLLHGFAASECVEKGCIRVLKSLGFPSHTVSFVGFPYPRRLSIFHSPFSILNHPSKK